MMKLEAAAAMSCNKPRPAVLDKVGGHPLAAMRHTFRERSAVEILPCSVLLCGPVGSGAHKLCVATCPGFLPLSCVSQ